MSDPGLTTPLQPVDRGSGRRPVLAGAALVALIVLLAWQPWAGTDPTGRRALDTSPSAASSLEPNVSPTPTAAPTTGPWSGRIADEWSIVAFLRAEAVPREPLVLVQEPVAVFVELGSGQGTSGTLPVSICDRTAAVSLPGGAVLPSGEVRLLGIAGPSGRGLVVTRISGLPDDLRAERMDLGRVSGVGAVLPPIRRFPSLPGPGSPPTSADDAVRIYALAGGVSWPNGVYRFEVATRDGLPGALYACIR